MNSVILHVDMNNFFASVSCRSHPELVGKPVAICGDIEKRHGIVLAKNNIAKARGVKTGSTIGEASFICPDLCMLPPDNTLYLEVSKQAKRIYYDYTSQVESFGIDECWLDVTGSLRLFGDGVTIADEIRRRIREELGVTASVGVSYNKIFAKMGSDYKKPDATTLITEDNFRDLLWPLPVSDLLFVGRATRSKLHLWGIDTIGDLAQANFQEIVGLLGKCGAGLWQFANGLDRTPVAEGDHMPIIKSVGNSTTAPRDLVTAEDVYITMRVLSESVAARLRADRLCCSTVQIELRDTRLSVISRQRQVYYPTNLSEEILSAAFSLFRATCPRDLRQMPLRSVAVRAAQLSSEDDGAQLSLDFDAGRHARMEALERTVDRLRTRFGDRVIRRAHLYTDPLLSGFCPKNENQIHPEPFMKGS
ncbi:MAG: DNA polymerase IV [Clostridia bacterium]|nr:DNA polymerase IV [Clostridia bacterium]